MEAGGLVMHGLQGRAKTSNTPRQSAWDALLRNDGPKERRIEASRERLARKERSRAHAAN